MLKSKCVKQEIEKSNTSQIQAIKERLYKGGFIPIIWSGYITDYVYIKVYYNTISERNQINKIIKEVINIDN